MFGHEPDTAVADSGRGVPRERAITTSAELTSPTCQAPAQLPAAEAPPGGEHTVVVLSATISPLSIELSSRAPGLTAAMNKRYSPQGSLPVQACVKNAGCLNVNGVVRSTPETIGRNVAGFAKLPTPLANAGSVKNTTVSPS